MTVATSAAVAKAGSGTKELDPPIIHDSGSSGKLETENVQHYIDNVDIYSDLIEKALLHVPELGPKFQAVCVLCPSTSVTPSYDIVLDSAEDCATPGCTISEETLFSHFNCQACGDNPETFDVRVVTVMHSDCGVLPSYIVTGASSNYHQGEPYFIK